MEGRVHKLGKFAGCSGEMKPADKLKWKQLTVKREPSKSHKQEINKNVVMFCLLRFIGNNPNKLNSTKQLCRNGA